jgi:hypothetical protein
MVLEESGMETFALILTLVLTCIAAVSSAVAAGAAWRTVKITQDTYQGQLFTDLSDVYNSPEMLNGMLWLTNWVRENPNNYAEKFIKIRKEDYTQIEKLDQSRRLVKSYFVRVYRLRRVNLLQDKLEKLLLNDQQIGFLLKILEPLECVIRSKASTESGGKRPLNPEVSVH